MKKAVSILLMLCMLGALLVPLTVSASAEEKLPSANYTFDDWKDPFAYAADKFKNMSTAVASINGNPVLSIYPLQGASFSWTHETMPFRFARQKTYVLSYDIAIMEQLGKSELVDAQLIPVVCNSTHVSEAAAHGDTTFSKIQRVFSSEDPNFTVVTPGAWKHVQATVSIPSEEGMGWEPDSLGFYEGDKAGANTHFVIDNLVLMEKSEFESVYPNGVPARTDDVTVGFDQVRSDFNSSRYMALRSSLETVNSPSVVMAGDAYLTWNLKAGETNLFVPFHFQAGKTYKVAFDMTLDDGAKAGSEAVSETKLVAAASTGKTITGATLQKFKSGDDEFVTAKKGEWTHVEMMLTVNSDADYKYFTLWQDPYTSKFYIDNFAIAEESNFPTMPTRTMAYATKALLLDFEDGNSFFKNIYNSNRIDLSVVEAQNSYGVVSKMLKMEPLTGGKAYNRIIAPFAFTKDKTYVISFDAMVYGQFGGAEAGDTSLAIYALNFDYTLFEDSGKSVNLGSKTVKAGEWTHITMEVTMPSKGDLNYIGLCEMTQNDNNAGFYIDNFTVALKSAACTDEAHAEGAMWVETKQVSCAADGERQLICATCGQVIKTEVIPAGAHIPGEWVTTVEPTCTEKGSKHRLCTVCNSEVDTAEIDATGHISGDWVETKAPTCTEEGSKHKLCTVCNEETAVSSVPTSAHTPGDWIIDKPAAVGEEGHRHKDCTVCGQKVREDTIPALDPPETTAPTTTEKPADQDDAGCKSVIGGGCLALVAVLTLGGAVVCKKKK